MAGITAIFGNSAEKSSQDDDKLMDLYWNRNELKKEFADLRKEKYKLNDRLKIQQGDIARLEQKLEHLEGLLIDPEWARSVLVMYQLRRLGRRCEGKLARFAEQLKQQRESRQQSQALAAWRAAVNAEVAVIEEGIAQTRGQVARLEEEIISLHHELNEAGGFLRFLRRRNVNRQVHALTREIQSLEQSEQGQRENIASIRGREPPETVGLDLPAKRLINFMIISYAQQLYVNFADDDLVALIKEACDKSAGAVRYGSDAECDELLERIQRGAASLHSADDFAAVLKKRATLISEGAIFKEADHAVPIAGTVATLFRIDANDRIRTASADLLGRNFWGLADVLSR
jgi:chromosome segregation ATPase